MNISEKNAQYIQLLNQNIQVLSQNIETLEEGMKKLDDSMSNVGRDSAAMQRAVIEFLKEKKIIKDDEDVKLLQKLHLRNIAQLDQEITKRKEKRDQ
jgi:hypothetical protein